MNQPQTIIDKLWSAHEIVRRDDGESLLWVDRHYVHEGSFHAFGKLAERRAAIAEPALTYGVADHYVPTRGSRHNIANPEISRMVRQLEENCAKHGIKLFGLDDPRQGIVHVVGPEQGLTVPGLLIVCGDSHTSTHGALGAYAFGIGASEVAHVLMTGTIWQKKPKRMRVSVDGLLLPGISAKDIVLAIIASIGADGATGCAVEFAGSAIRALSMEGRLTLCNMSIGLDAAAIESIVTWVTSPQDALPIDASAPDPRCESNPERAQYLREALDYMGITPGKRLTEVAIDRVFIGSCTNARIEDLRAAAAVLAGRASRVPGLVSPGSTLVKRQAEEEGLDRIFREAGLEWGESGCSMCVGINGDLVRPGERCASTTNRNFRGRQGPGARTHLMSPAMVAAAAVTGHLADVRELLGDRKV